jgi:hypothetical protein
MTRIPYCSPCFLYVNATPASATFLLWPHFTCLECGCYFMAYTGRIYISWRRNGVSSYAFWKRATVASDFTVSQLNLRCSSFFLYETETAFLAKLPAYLHSVTKSTLRALTLSAVGTNNLVPQRNGFQTCFVFLKILSWNLGPGTRLCWYVPQGKYWNNTLKSTTTLASVPFHWTLSASQELYSGGTVHPLRI